LKKKKRLGNEFLCFTQRSSEILLFEVQTFLLDFNPGPFVCSSDLIQEMNLIQLMLICFSKYPLVKGTNQVIHLNQCSRLLCCNFSSFNKEQNLFLINSCNKYNYLYKAPVIILLQKLCNLNSHLEQLIINYLSAG